MQKYPTQKLHQIYPSSQIEIDKLLKSHLQDNYVQWNIFSQISSKFKLQKISHQQAAAIYTNLHNKESFKNYNTKKNWKSQELQLLVFLLEKYCSINSIEKLNYLQNSHWEQFSCFISGRTANECKFKIMSLTAETITNDPWTEEERNILNQLIQEQGMNWNNISQKLFQTSQRKVFRTSKQCRQHFMCFLKPNLKKGVWTQEQDYKLICLFLSHGKKWSKIMKSLQVRNQNSIKNRFFLLFENKSRAINNSDLIRKVKRKKQKIQKTFSTSQLQWKQHISLTQNYYLSSSQKNQSFRLKSLKQIQEQVKKEENSEQTKKSMEESIHETQQNRLNYLLQRGLMQMDVEQPNRQSCQNIGGLTGYNNSFLYHSKLSQELIFQSFEQYISF